MSTGVCVSISMPAECVGTYDNFKDAIVPIAAPAKQAMKHALDPRNLLNLAQGVRLAG